MAAAGAAELLLPALQPLELWQRTGRDQALGEVMLRFTDRRGRKLCLGPTHEEVITELAKNHISSYRQLPLTLYQIQTKFRDEIRPRFGLVRSCEFVMKDAYSFDKDQAGLERNYKLMLEAYRNIFRRCGLDFLVIEADPGVMGGAVSHEFMVPAENGEDAVFSCPKCKKALGFKEGALPACPACGGTMEQAACIEAGHIFQLGTKYSVALGANFLDDKGKLQPIIMGCYGIGVSRLISAVIEQNRDQNGIIWPKEVAPYQALIVALDTGDAGIGQEARVIYSALQKTGINVLWDDREERAGVKFKDADLIGIPVQVIVGKNTLKDGSVEIKLRGKEEKRIVKKEEALEAIKTIV
jgi:prolyl-tRNA synthetase